MLGEGQTQALAATAGVPSVAGKGRLAVVAQTSVSIIVVCCIFPHGQLLAPAIGFSSKCCSPSLHWYIFTRRKDQLVTDPGQVIRGIYRDLSAVCAVTRGRFVRW